MPEYIDNAVPADIKTVLPQEIADELEYAGVNSAYAPCTKSREHWVNHRLAIARHILKTFEVKHR